MNIVRALISDLVDKRLWPIAVLLVVALVAVPVMLGGGGSDASSGVSLAPLPVADAAAGPVAAVELAGPPSVRSRPGHDRNPFRRPPVKVDATTSTTPTAAAGAGATTDGGTTAPGSGTTTTPTETPTDRIDTTKTIDVKFGTTGHLNAMSNVKSGTDLPAGPSGVIRYAGVVADTKIARFVAVNKTLGKTNGDAKCYHKNNLCFALDMKAGDKQSFTVDGTTYEIEIVSVPQGGSGNAATEDATVSHSYYRTTISMGSAATDALGSPRPLSRLAPLPNATDPAAIYLGVGSKGATFLLASGTTATGDGDCLDTDCRIVSLAEGESTLLEVTPADGSAPQQYTLEVVTVEAVNTTDALAKTMRTHVHPAGRDTLTALLEDPAAATAIGPITYDATTGLLVEAASVTKVATP